MLKILYSLLLLIFHMVLFVNVLRSSTVPFLGVPLLLYSTVVQRNDLKPGIKTN